MDVLVDGCVDLDAARLAGDGDIAAGAQGGQGHIVAGRQGQVGVAAHHAADVHGEAAIDSQAQVGRFGVKGIATGQRGAGQRGVTADVANERAAGGDAGVAHAQVAVGGGQGQIALGTDRSVAERHIALGVQIQVVAGGQGGTAGNTQIAVAGGGLQITTDGVHQGTVAHAYVTAGVQSGVGGRFRPAAVGEDNAAFLAAQGQSPGGRGATAVGEGYVAAARI